MYISSFIQNDVTILEEKKILKLNSKLRISLKFCVYFFKTLFKYTLLIIITYKVFCLGYITLKCKQHKHKG